MTSSSTLFFFFFFFPFLVVLLHPPRLTIALTLPADVKALSAFKASVLASSIPPYSCLSSWNFTVDPCAIPRRTHFTCGVSCSSTTNPSRITAITLDPAGYSGKLTSYISNLTALSHLDLSENNFYGPITAAAFSSLSSLKTLSLPSNSFTGKLASDVFSNLTSLVLLDLSNNAISGEVPTGLARLMSLTTLDLSFNRLTGKLSGPLPPNLVQLSVRGNRLTGNLPRPTFEALKYLKVVELAANGFSGGVEAWLLRLPVLQQLDLANNSLSYVAVGSKAGKSNVVAMDLGFNKIEGCLPAEVAAPTQFPDLVALSFRHNRLKGGIPAEYRRFRRLFLDGNFLNGKVPKGFLVSGEVAGSFGDNCLDDCPAGIPLCAPEQKPLAICKQAYSGKASSPLQ